MLNWFTVLFRSTIPSTFLFILLIFEFYIETPTKKILICLLKKIIVLYSGTICNFALYLPSLPLNVLSYFHNLKNKKKGKKRIWSGLPFPPPRDLPNPGSEPTSLVSPALAGRFFTTAPAGKPS